MTYYWLINIIIGFLLCLVLTFFTTRYIAELAHRRRWYDMPNIRSVHSDPTPRLGGLTFFPVIAFTFTLVFSFSNWIEQLEAKEYESLSDVRILCIFSSLLLLYGLGVADDILGVRYRKKFIIELMVSALLILSGLYFFHFHGFLGLGDVSLYVSIPFTVLLTISIINSLNMIDGIDGLCSGLGIIGFGYYGIFFYFCGNYILTFIAVCMLGCLLSFFYYNVFGSREKHRKMFMGDTGSMTLGLLFCCMSLELTTVKSSPLVEDVNVLVLAYSPLIVPCFDLIRVFAYRLRHHRNPFKADKHHIHHKLMCVGLTQHEALVSILFLAVGFIGLNLSLSPFVNVTWLVILDILIYTVLNIWLDRKIKEKEIEEQREQKEK